MNYSGLKAILDAQSLTSFVWISAKIPTGDLGRALVDDVVLEG